ncbi:MAG: hypothetical protein MI723_08515 [Caulobacterales bacterium]|nr:hypothetical protein [Caulobacterales bacterium]
MSTAWFFVVVGVLVLAAGAALQAFSLSWRRRNRPTPGGARRARRAARRRS